MRRRGRRWRVGATLVLAGCAPGCGALGGVLGGNTATCQTLADSLYACPDLFGAGVWEGFLAPPGPPRAFYTYNVQACALRLDGASAPCLTAANHFVACVGGRACAELPAACAAPLAALKRDCSALVGGASDPNR